MLQIIYPFLPSRAPALLHRLLVSLTSTVSFSCFHLHLQAGRHAGILNQIISELPPDHLLSDKQPLHVALGHTPLQVIAGMLVGMVIGYITQNSLDAISTLQHRGGGAEGNLVTPVLLQRQGHHGPPP